MNKQIILRSVKGCSLSVMVALYLWGPAGAMALEARTGYGQRQILRSLKALEGMGLAGRVSYREWGLLDGSQFFVASHAEVDIKSTSDYVMSTSDTLCHAEVDIKSTSGCLVSSSRSTRLLDKPLTSFDLLKICHELGIKGKKAKQISELPHVLQLGPDYIVDHVRLADSLPLAIYRIVEGWDVREEKLSSGEVPDEFKDIVKR